MNSWKRIQYVMALMIGLFGAQRVVAIDLDKATEKKGMVAVGKGAKYLIEKQNADGSWGRTKHPAVAALCVMAINNAPDVPAEKRDAAVDKGLKFVLGYVQADGSIYPAKTHRANPTASAYYPNYTTAVTLLCLATVDKKEYLPHMKKARAYLKSIQFKDRSQVDFGGIGYGKTQRADLSNSGFAAEALYFTEHLDREPYTKDPELDKQNKQLWADMAEFVTKTQNLPETNKQPYVSKDPKDRGGFFYRPLESKAGSRDGEGKKTSLISSSSMTYAGVKSMLYANLKPNDKRVKAAMDFLMRHYVLNENPGMGQQGLYYYLHVMTRALRVYGQETLTGPKGEKHMWRKDVIEQFILMQRADGSWVNKNARFMESDPILCTAYALITLKDAADKSALKRK